MAPVRGPGGPGTLPLLRRSRRDRRRPACHLVFCPARTNLAEPAGAAGRRRTIGECFRGQAAIPALAIARPAPGMAGTGMSARSCFPAGPAAEPGIGARGRQDRRGPDPETGALPS